MMIRPEVEGRSAIARGQPARPGAVIVRALARLCYRQRLERVPHTAEETYVRRLVMRKDRCYPRERSAIRVEIPHYQGR
jgi:hypothetical protein